MWLALGILESRAGLVAVKKVVARFFRSAAATSDLPAQGSASGSGSVAQR